MTFFEIIEGVFYPLVHLKMVGEKIDQNLMVIIKATQRMNLIV